MTTASGIPYEQVARDDDTVEYQCAWDDRYEVVNHLLRTSARNVEIIGGNASRDAHGNILFEHARIVVKR